MGRYKSAQIFHDSATAKVKIDGIAEARTESVSSTPTGSSAAPKPEKIERAVGSTAGAASSEFHLYRAARRRELTRIGLLEKKAAEEKEAQELAAKIEANKREAEERTLKNVSKRKKRKMKARCYKNDVVGDKSEGQKGETEDSSKKSKTAMMTLHDFSDSENENEAEIGSKTDGVDQATLMRLLLLQQDS